MDTCHMQRRFVAKFEAAVQNSNMEVYEAAKSIAWLIIGCQEHKVAKPCGNKMELGVPWKADCKACPLAEAVSSFEV